MPLVILSRLDDVFVLPAMVLGLLFFPAARRMRVACAAWLVGPSGVALVAYLTYNVATVHAAMPLSGATKSGFVGAMAIYLTAALHFPPILNLHSALTHKPVEEAVVFSNGFRFVEVIYPLAIGAFGALGLWRYGRRRAANWVWFGICLYLVFKMGWNLMMVHPWHQANWYYGFAVLSLSVLGAMALRGAWDRLVAWPVAKWGVVTVYLGVMMLAGAQYYASIVDADADTLHTMAFWERYPAVRAGLVANGVTGVINEDDGITAFLLDLPMMHGFAFATDVQAQKAHRDGEMLTLAYARGINAIAGFGYLGTDQPPETDAGIREFLASSLAEESIRNDVGKFTFSLAYYDPVLRMAFFKFVPKA